MDFQHGPLELEATWVVRTQGSSQGKNIGEVLQRGSQTYIVQNRDELQNRIKSLQSSVFAEAFPQFHQARPGGKTNLGLLLLGVEVRVILVVLCVLIDYYMVLFN